MKHQEKPATTAMRERVRGIVIGAGFVGLTMTEIGNRAGVVRETVRAYVHGLRNDGAIECSHPYGGTVCVWGAPGIAAVFEAAALERERIATAEKSARRNKPAAIKRTRTEIEVDAFARPSIARIVPAHLAAPLRPRGPSSVWELAA